jgi:hypothetical protein
MSDFDQCRKCHQYAFLGRHTCHPFTVECEGETEERWGYDEENVAKSYAQNYNECGDYTMMDGEPIEVTVNGRLFRVTAEPSIDYYVTEVEDSK